MLRKRIADRSESSSSGEGGLACLDSHPTRAPNASSSVATSSSQLRKARASSAAGSRESAEISPAQLQVTGYRLPVISYQ